MMNAATTPIVIGAYAALPAERADQELFYAQISQKLGATGLELPVRDCLHEDKMWLGGQLAGRFTSCVVTLIPGTMGRVGADPRFGLASPDSEGREAALAFTRSVIDEVRTLNEFAGERVVESIELHSAPSVTADAQAFIRSLVELEEGLTIMDPRLVIEHCDRYHESFEGEKRFLSVEQEIGAAKEAGVGITVNWGRSALEAHDASVPAAQVELLRAEGVLEGLMFSGASGQETAYGRAWGDVHLPHCFDEPASLMGDPEILSCLEAAKGSCRYLGAKIQAPASASIDERIAMLGRITGLFGAR